MKKLLTKGELNLDGLRKDTEEKLIQLSNLEKDAKLVASCHDKAVLWLIADPAAHTFVQSLADEM